MVRSKFFLVEVVETFIYIQTS